jgi:hypothetical protein
MCEIRASQRQKLEQQNAYRPAQRTVVNFFNVSVRVWDITARAFENNLSGFTNLMPLCNLLKIAYI